MSHSAGGGGGVRALGLVRAQGCRPARWLRWIGWRAGTRGRRAGLRIGHAPFGLLPGNRVSGREDLEGDGGGAGGLRRCESFFATLECELLDRQRFHSQAEAKLAVFEFLEGWYNPRRRHSALGYLSPAEFEKRRKAA